MQLLLSGDFDSAKNAGLSDKCNPDRDHPSRACSFCLSGRDIKIYTKVVRMLFRTICRAAAALSAGIPASEAKQTTVNPVKNIR